jgi:hypothetical protein
VGAERDRLDPDGRGLTPWHDWGPFVADRAWGTVREDYRADGDAWVAVPHDHARSRAYRWGEDGLAGVCDRRQGMVLALALWNGRDPILKERLFGLANAEGNHGEDVKEHWWHVDAVPSSSWLVWRYHYPQAAFPYERLVAENATRTVADDEFELVDTGVFDDGRFWGVEVTYAKAAPDDLLMRVRVRNHGPDVDTLHVLPTLWFRNTWSWQDEEPDRPNLVLVDRAATGAGSRQVVVADHPVLGRWVLQAGAGPDGGRPVPLFCTNETNAARLYGTPNAVPFPKDGINDHVVHGAATVDPARHGTRTAWWYEVAVAPGEQVELRLRLTRAGEVDAELTGEPADDPALALGPDFDAVVAARQSEADEFHAELTGRDLTPDEAAVQRRAFAGLLWTQQFYRYEVDRWLRGDPAGPAPPPGRGDIRNGTWRHLDANDVILVPDGWEYPWFASWDLAFHAITMAFVDPAAAKRQLLLLTREWYMHPNGALPAYEWNFGDANPPVHAFAAKRVFEIDGRRDLDFLERMLHKLVINFTWWVNRQDLEGDNVFEGGFLGLDNIGPFNRSQPLPGGALLEQSDGTAWMAMYCLDLLDIALTLAERDRTYEDLAVKFLEHFAMIAAAMNASGLWDDEDGFYYDQLRLSSGETQRVRVRSMVGLIPLFANTVVGVDQMRALPDFDERARWFFAHHPEYRAHLGTVVRDGRSLALLSVVTPERLPQILGPLLDPGEFLSDHGLRSLSKRHRDAPVSVSLGEVTSTVSYEPGASRSRLFGGNSNWRGPVWFPTNFLVLHGLLRYTRYLGPDHPVEFPTGSGRTVGLATVVDDLSRRLVGLFTRGADGRRPFLGDRPLLQGDPAWRDEIAFHEYFHGDTGAGLGASHQTGWTALVANLLLARRLRWL